MFYITQEDTNLKYDKQLSNKLHEKYKHEIRFCYSNAYELFENDDITSLVIGFVTYDLFKEIKRFGRHAWGIKDNKIVDSTLAGGLEGAEYFEAFRITGPAEMFKAMNTGNESFQGVNDKAEKDTIEILKKCYGNNIEIV